eukprot:GHVU01108997.1.p1 GENE.GHVU01108997.1~~GHVU01108997.1.p1  ORF type:complete len:202 (+),score=40.16 GHVU01108997.1:189-794(+)
MRTQEYHTAQQRQQPMQPGEFLQYDAEVSFGAGASGWKKERDNDADYHSNGEDWVEVGAIEDIDGESSHISSGNTSSGSVGSDRDRVARRRRLLRLGEKKLADAVSLPHPQHRQPRHKVERRIPAAPTGAGVRSRQRRDSDEDTSLSHWSDMNEEQRLDEEYEEEEEEWEGGYRDGVGRGLPARHESTSTIDYIYGDDVSE